MKGELSSKSPDLLGLKPCSITVKHSQKTELNISAFKVFNKRIIITNKKCMVLVCYLWIYQEFYLINFQLFQRFFIIILKKQIKFINVAVRGIFRILYKSFFEASVGYLVDMLRLIQEQIKYCAFTRQKVIVIKEIQIT